MTDQATGDMPWMQQAGPAAASAAPIREPRQKRKPREAAAPKKERKPRVAKPPAEAASAAPKKPRKAKKEKAERAAPDTIKVDLKEYAHMRIAPAAKELLKIHKIMSGVPASLRARLLVELQKVFG